MDPRLDSEREQGSGGAGGPLERYLPLLGTIAALRDAQRATHCRSRGRWSAALSEGGPGPLRIALRAVATEPLGSSRTEGERADDSAIDDLAARNLIDSAIASHPDAPRPPAGRPVSNPR